MIISARNWLTDLTASSVQAPGTATGYAIENLWMGGPGRVWRSTTPSTNEPWIDFRLTANRPVNLIAVFGAKEAEWIEVRRDPNWPHGLLGSSTLVGTITPDERGDGALYLPVPEQEETWFLVFGLPGALPFSVGEVWFDEVTPLSRTYATRQDAIDYHTIVNISEAQTTRTAELADYTRRISLGWDRLYDAERNEITQVFHAARGAGRPVVLLPRDDASEVYHGRLQAQLTYGIDYPVNTGIRIDFQESGRPLGA